MPTEVLKGIQMTPEKEVKDYAAKNSGIVDNNLSPAMKQHAAFKGKYPDTVILMKMGDFYEAFGDDAKILNKELGLTLTKRGDIPMAGLPYHSIDSYLKKLVEAGHKVAIVEETSKKLTGKIVRDIVKLTTPGIEADKKILAQTRPAAEAGTKEIKHEEAITEPCHKS